MSGGVGMGTVTLTFTLLLALPFIPTQLDTILRPPPRSIAGIDALNLRSL